MEVIDVTLYNRKVIERVLNWRVSERSTMSDHRAIRFDILYGSKTRDEKVMVRNPRNTDHTICGNVAG